jgi:hypothetical protein
MKIYKQEIADGVDSLITSNASITYASIAEPCSEAQNFNFKSIKSVAALEDKDLYYVQSILVSSNWNKNDDIFDKGEVWKAKNTPEDKPTNLEHDENIIIGHITSNYPINEEGNIIPVDTSEEDLPNKYHILTGSVIYRAFSNPELKQRAETLIAEIEDGTKYVSMECYFNNFDYGLKNESTGEFKVLARKEDTAYLTKHLRAYGGTGHHEGYTIGRVLRNITFSGKGFVDKPANSESIIFSRTMLDKFLQDKNTDFEKKGVIDNKPFSKPEKKIMNLEDTVEKMNKKLESLLTSEAFASTYSKASDLETKVSELETKAEESAEALTEQNEKFTALEASIAEKDELVKALEEEKTSLKEQLDSANEVLAGYKEKEEEMAKKEKALKRRASLVEAGLDDEAAEAAVAKFENLDDESFDSIALVITEAAKTAEAKMPPALKEALDKKKDKEEDEEAVMKKKPKASEEIVAEETEDTEAAEEEADEAVAEASDLENVETDEEVSLSVAGEEEVSAVETTRAALVDFVKSRLQTK